MYPCPQLLWRAEEVPGRRTKVHTGDRPLRSFPGGRRGESPRQRPPVNCILNAKTDVRRGHWPTSHANMLASNGGRCVFWIWMSRHWLSVYFRQFIVPLTFHTFIQATRIPTAMWSAFIRQIESKSCAVLVSWLQMQSVCSAAHHHGFYYMISILQLSYAVPQRSPRSLVQN